MVKVPRTARTSSTTRRTESPRAISLMLIRKDTNSRIRWSKFPIWHSIKRWIHFRKISQNFCFSDDYRMFSDQRLPEQNQRREGERDKIPHSHEAQVGWNRGGKIELLLTNPTHFFTQINRFISTRRNQIRIQAKTLQQVAAEFEAA